MAVLASDVMAGAAALLNDPSQRWYTNDKLLPFMKKAYRDLEQDLDYKGQRTLDEVSADISVPAGTTTITVPSDFVSPIWLGERTPNSTEEWIEMEEKRWEPDITPGRMLNYWTWREEQIQMPGAVVDREVRIRYKKSLSPVTSASSNIAVPRAQTFLESMVASLAAKYLGEDIARGRELDLDSGRALTKLTGIGTKQQQGRSVRRRRYGSGLRRITS